ncbi:Non-homologous end joining protein Ku [Paraconexibacter sp. AEG42_29]|uniref:Non-homologous end joining protein Ku n=1 Tax=Paraconexibacter sp. AEG42_29 TaxID=2997339 RepID=A0AAU7AUZ9_9ACTN
MPRSLLNATIVFGEVSVPVKLHTAQTSQSISFKEIHLEDGAKIEHRRFCAEEDKEVPYEEIAKGHEVADGKYAVLTQEQLAAATPGGSKTIAVEEFVPVDDIDPILHDRAYHLGAGKDAGAAYRLLHDALAKTKRAGIGYFVFHDRERLAAIRAQDGILVLQTLRAADAVVDLDTLKPDAADDARAPTAKERKMAEQLTEALHEPFVAADHTDEHRELVLKLIEAKAAGEDVELPEVEEQDAPDDLAAALEASLADREHSGRRRRASPTKKPAAAAKKRRRSPSSGGKARKSKGS